MSDKLGNHVIIETGKLDANASSPDGIYPFFTCSKDPLQISSYSYDCECVLVAGNGDLNVKYYDGKFDAYQRTYIIESLDKTILDTRFLYYFLDKNIIKLRNLSIGGIIKYIKLGNLTDLPIKLPKLSQQKEIVATLDKANELIALRKKQLQELDALAESVFYELFGDPVKNEKGWCIVKMKECLHNIVNGTSPVCENRAKRTDEYGVLKLSAVTYGSYNEKENKALPYGVPFDKKAEVSQGDLLMTRKNTFELVGMSAYVFSTIPYLMLPDIIFRIDTNEKIKKIYLWKLINNSFFRNKIKMLATGAAASMPNISKAKLNNLDLPLPPLSLQIRFSAIIEKIEEQKAQVKKALQESEDLFQRLMQDLFRPD
ncbi:MAG: restriction endonuclease subunit S [Paludibacteraceae bacterium]